MTAKARIPAGHGVRHDRTVQKYEHDTSKLRGKLKEPTICSKCSAVFHNRRRTWEMKPAGAGQIICPACMRIRDKNPKGLITLKGQFKDAQHKQVIGLVKDAEERENQKHPSLSNHVDRIQSRGPYHFHGRQPFTEVHRRTIETMAIVASWNCTTTKTKIVCASHGRDETDRPHAPEANPYQKEVTTS